MTPVESTEAGLPRRHLKPGELIVTRDAQMVTTVLGSCVAVTLFDRHSGLASICHAMLACPPAERPGSNQDTHPYRYVDQAVPAMLDVYRRARIDPERIEAMIFGGSSIIAAERPCAAGSQVGSVNVEMAKAILRRARVSVKAENTGGPRGRKILFNTATGEVLHKHLARTTP